MVVWFCRDAETERNVPRSVIVYSCSRIAAVNAWMGKAMYWWYHVEYAVAHGTQDVSFREKKNIKLNEIKIKLKN